MKGKGSPAILHIDIETAPILASCWGLFDQNINFESIVADWYIISIAYQWDCEDKIYSMTVKADDHRNDKKVIERMHELLSAADIVVAHNGDSFDVKKFMARCIYHDLGPPAPFQTVDTLKAARRVFKFTSNKLDYIGQFLGLGKKVDTPKGLWMKACFGTLKERRDALREMARYNEGDIILLKKVYHKLKPYMVSHPHHGHYHPDHVCRNCGSSHLQRQGTRIVGTGRRQRFQCQDCGAWSVGKLVSKVATS